MSTNAQWSPLAIPLRGMDVTPKALQWYAVHTRARHEKVVAQRLQEGGVATFLPVVTEEHRWSDRKKLVEVPLFSCYVFVQLAPTSEERARVLNIDSVLQFVGIGGRELRFLVRRSMPSALSWMSGYSGPAIPISRSDSGFASAAAHSMA